MPITTICVRPVSGENAFGDVEEGDFQLVTSHPAEMGYSPSMRRRRGLANVLSDLTDDQLARLQTMRKSVDQDPEMESQPSKYIDRSILRSARYRSRRNAVDLPNAAELQRDVTTPDHSRVRVVEGEVCGGMRNIHKQPLQDNWVCG